MLQPAVSFHRSTLLGSYGGRKSLKIFREKFPPFGKNDPLRENFQNFVPKGFIATQIHMLLANFVKFSCQEVGEIARCLNHENKQNVALLSRSRFSADRAQNVPGSAANNVLRAPRISSKSVHFRWSYYRTREHRSNAP